MRSVMVYDLLKKRVLVTREPARLIRPAIAKALAENQGEIALELSGVQGITPSFLDEALSIVEDCVAASRKTYSRATMEDPPTLLSLKYAAIARAHGLAVEDSGTDSWIVSKGSVNTTT